MVLTTSTSGLGWSLSTYTASIARRHLRASAPRHLRLPGGHLRSDEASSGRICGTRSSGA
jgi:hypothetical protein